MIRIIFENKKLLVEVDMAKVQERFRTSDFKDATIKSKGVYGYQRMDFNEDSPNLRRIFAKTHILETLPQDISEPDQAHALNWLISVFIRTGGMAAPNIPKNKKDLELFFQIKSRRKNFLTKKDIYTIQDYDELSQVIEDALPSWTAYTQKQDQKDAVKGMHKIYQNDDWNVFIPETKAAACKLADGAEWCTGARGLPYYEDYHSPDDPLIIFISKKETFKKPVKVYNKETREEELVEKTFPEKYQFYYGVSGRRSPQFMDKDDRTIRTTKTLGLYYKLNCIVKDINNLPDEVKNEAKKKCKTFEDLPNGGMKVYDHDGISYYNAKGQRHREDGPAQIKYNDEGKIVSEEWMTNGYSNREDGPAYIEYDNSGTIKEKQWRIKGFLHREDGPARMSSDGNEYYLDGRPFTKKDYEEKLEDRKLPFEESLKRKSLRIIFN